ncbi:TPA: hypothetical protein IAB29_00710 [Candidatus Ventrenecus stercoripullorum]|nr:hypothetical protein [Candidatus Ventrenecus stercoripullorum]
MKESTINLILSVIFWICAIITLITSGSDYSFLLSMMMCMFYLVISKIEKIKEDKDD